MGIHFEIYVGEELLDSRTSLAKNESFKFMGLKPH
jgi:hypothetical protein